MPDLPPAAPAPRRRRAPGARSLIAGALASAVAVFGVLALRVHAGDDPALGQVKAATRGSATTTGETTTSSSSSAVDPYDAPAFGDEDDSAGATSGDDQSSAAAPTTRAS